jgi:hypothetical protein
MSASFSHSAAGTWPDKLLPVNVRVSNSVNKPKEDGNVPLSWLLGAVKTVRLARLPMFAGIAPLHPIEKLSHVRSETITIDS